MRHLFKIFIILFTVFFVFGNAMTSQAAGKEKRAVIRVKIENDAIWKPFSDEDDAGTTGQSRRLEGISLELYNCDQKIEYRIYTPDNGWSPWKADGEKLTNGGGDTPIIGLQIRVIDRKTNVPLDFEYRVHVAEIGWSHYYKNNEEAGNFKYRIEAVTIRFPNKAMGSISIDDL